MKGKPVKREDQTHRSQQKEACPEKKKECFGPKKKERKNVDQKVKT